MTLERGIPLEAEIVDRVEESPTIFTLSLRLVDEQLHDQYSFEAGQFNMLYLFGVGEIPVSVADDPDAPGYLQHTIRSVGRVTRGIAQLPLGARLGLRGPFGRGWPMQSLEGKNLLIVTGGLGCAPVLPVIKKMIHHRDHYGNVAILQGVKHSEEMIWRERYGMWAALPNTRVLLAADVAGPNWPGIQGQVPALFEQLDMEAANTVTLLCGPEPMMVASVQQLLARGFAPDSIWMSMERNMQCAVGQCGHCQYGEVFICRNGPVFPYTEIQHLLGVRSV
jgi:sulfhydrogenase subunit gamma (sulfur reductase)